MKKISITAVLFISSTLLLGFGCTKQDGPAAPAPTATNTPNATQTIASIATAIAGINAANTAVALVTLTHEASLFTPTLTPTNTPVPADTNTPNATQTVAAIATAIAGINAANTAEALLTLTHEASLFTPTITATASLTPTFTATRVLYSLNISTSLGGSVQSGTLDILCPSLCSNSFGAGASVVLNAVPESGKAFAGWSGACTGTGSCNITMDSAKNVSALFTTAVTVVKAGAGNGTVTSSPAGINCGATCSGNYETGMNVNLTAAADSNSIFTGWSGDASGSAGTCQVNLSAPRLVTATFAPKTYALAVVKTGNGTVVSDITGIYCGVDCGASYDYGTTVFLTAVPDAGSTFIGWTGACTGIGSCGVSMTSAKSVGASFTP